jgi:hypothetical protein
MLSVKFKDPIYADECTHNEGSVNLSTCICIVYMGIIFCKTAFRPLSFAVHGVLSLLKHNCQTTCKH